MSRFRLMVSYSFACRLAAVYCAYKVPFRAVSSDSSASRFSATGRGTAPNRFSSRAAASKAYYGNNAYYVRIKGVLVFNKVCPYVCKQFLLGLQAMKKT